MGLASATQRSTLKLLSGRGYFGVAICTRTLPSFHASTNQIRHPWRVWQASLLALLQVVVWLQERLRVVELALLPPAGLERLRVVELALLPPAGLERLRVVELALLPPAGLERLWVVELALLLMAELGPVLPGP